MRDRRHSLQSAEHPPSSIHSLSTTRLLWAARGHNALHSRQRMPQQFALDRLAARELSRKLDRRARPDLPAEIRDRANGHGLPRRPRNGILAVWQPGGHDWPEEQLASVVRCHSARADRVASLSILKPNNPLRWDPDAWPSCSYAIDIELSIRHRELVDKGGQGSVWDMAIHGGGIWSDFGIASVLVTDTDMEVVLHCELCDDDGAFRICALTSSRKSCISVRGMPIRCT